MLEAEVCTNGKQQLHTQVQERFKNIWGWNSQNIIGDGPLEKLWGGGARGGPKAKKKIPASENHGKKKIRAASCDAKKKVKKPQKNFLHR